MVDEASRGDILWRPSPEQAALARLTDFSRHAERVAGRSLSDYQQLHQWSTTDLDAFWTAIFHYFEVASPDRPGANVAPRGMSGARWFPGVRVNYARSALSADAERIALIARDELGARTEITYGELSRRVMACRAGLTRLGVGRGDRVAGYLPNCLEAVIAFLATASLGAVWSSCPPEFGRRSVLDRFSQIRPRVLIATDGYAYGGKWFERGAEVGAIRDALDGLHATVLLRRSQLPAPPHELDWDALCSAATPASGLEADWVDFDHPLWILYSSGTTGKPKAIVHSHGGMIVEHCKALALHGDLGPRDRFFWFSTTGWMMWNYLLGGLLVGCTIVLYEGSPAFPDLGALWRLIEAEGLTVFGTSAPFLMSCRARGVEPSAEADMSSLRMLGSTGAPLSPEGFRWVYDHVSPQVLLASVSGGTDMCTAFVTSCPWLPVRSGELQCAALGAAVAAFDARGRRVIGTLGELVITQPMPCMPLGFFGDDGTRYRESYFEHFPGVWRHGDWIVQFEDGAAVIHGRSDATLNRGGVRMGTAEFYRALEDLPALADSLVVELGGAGREGRLCLFVVLAPGHELDDRVTHQIHAALRANLSPRHVPDVICEVTEIPYTLSGKKLELPVKRVLEGASIEASSNPGTQRNPRALEQLVERARALGLGPPRPS